MAEPGIRSGESEKMVGESELSSSGSHFKKKMGSSRSVIKTVSILISAVSVWPNSSNYSGSFSIYSGERCFLFPRRFMKELSGKQCGGNKGHST